MVVVHNSAYEHLFQAGSDPRKLSPRTQPSIGWAPRYQPQGVTFIVPNLVDIWSAGCIIVELFAGKVLFGVKMDKNKYMKHEIEDLIWKNIVITLGTIQERFLLRLSPAKADHARQLLKDKKSKLTKDFYPETMNPILKWMKSLESDINRPIDMPPLCTSTNFYTFFKLLIGDDFRLKFY